MVIAVGFITDSHIVYFMAEHYSIKPHQYHIHVSKLLSSSSAAAAAAAAAFI